MNRDHRPLPAPWDGRAGCLPISDDRLLTSRDAAIWIVAVVEAYQRAEGVPLSPFGQRILDVHRSILRRAGRADESGDEATDDDAEEIGTVEAAAIIGCSREHASRLARDGVLGPTRRVGNRRLVRRRFAEAFAATRQAEAS